MKMSRNNESYVLNYSLLLISSSICNHTLTVEYQIYKQKRTPLQRQALWFSVQALRKNLFPVPVLPFTVGDKVNGNKTTGLEAYLSKRDWEGGRSEKLSR